MNAFKQAQTLCDLKLYTKPKNLLNHIEYIFSGYDFQDKRVLDIGGGCGLLSFWALLNGASHVVLLEPEFEGSTSGIISNIKSNSESLGISHCFDHYCLTIQDFLANSSDNFFFDCVVYANSVNHINESAVQNFLKDSGSRNFFIDHFSQLAKIAIDSNSRLFLSDCSRYNLFSQLPFVNPLMPAIEWDKHLSPSQWSGILAETGYSNFNLKWFSPNSFPSISPLISNKYLNYLTFSHFSLSASFST